MNKVKSKNVQRVRRKKRVRKAVFGDSQRPRLTVFRSLRHIYAQIIDDDSGSTLVTASSLAEKSMEKGGNIKASVQVGKVLARKAVDVGIRRVSFDRNGYKYHGRVKALAEAAREAGLVF
jgi:large subunit ribosomal protein L18